MGPQSSQRYSFIQKRLLPCVCPSKLESGRNHQSSCPCEGTGGRGGDITTPGASGGEDGPGQGAPSSCPCPFFRTFLAPQSRVSLHQGLLSLVSAPLQAGVIVAAPFYLGTAPMLATPEITPFSTRYPESAPLAQF